MLPFNTRQLRNSGSGGGALRGMSIWTAIRPASAAGPMAMRIDSSARMAAAARPISASVSPSKIVQDTSDPRIVETELECTGFSVSRANSVSATGTPSTYSTPWFTVRPNAG